MKKTSLFRAIVAICVIGLALLTVPVIVAGVLKGIASATVIDFLIVMAVALVAWAIRFGYECLAAGRKALRVSGVALVIVTILVAVAYAAQGIVTEASIAYEALRNNNSVVFTGIAIAGGILIALAIGMLVALCMGAADTDDEVREEKIREKDKEDTNPAKNPSSVEERQLPKSARKFYNYQTEGDPGEYAAREESRRSIRETLEGNADRFPSNEVRNDEADEVDEIETEEVEIGNEEIHSKYYADFFDGDIDDQREEA